MRRLLTSFVLALALVASLASSGCREADAATYGYTRPYTATCRTCTAVIWTIGDSIMHGAIPSPDGAGGWTYAYIGGYRRYVYAALVTAGRTPTMVGGLLNSSDGLPLSIAGLSHNGNNGTSAAQWVASTFATYQPGLAASPTIIAIALGANDTDGVGAGTSVGQVIDLAVASYPLANILVGNVTPQGPTGAAPTTTNAQIAVEVATRIRAGKHVQLVDQFTAVGKAAPDTQHPDQPSYNKLGNLWTQAIVPLVVW